ncbi:OsmC-like protein [Basidiobolus meristosporus CBS 931.73]|uniref:OsmC-like protein n=1 Tax=Basidiobolus meristosporus CBS 931.73 TaxID=1314790 RepID=A0A1Y1Y232_9FUNG|nr:OsmC-like protein [Basidiobolus meristosporus CBS 931.73]|eukprot:ORX92038.1 OsmC-like protein [Basidiobolus meristosporus CBS 931.73]
MLFSHSCISKALANPRLVNLTSRAFLSSRVVVSTTEGYRQEAQVQAHRLTIDEPVQLGGTDSGPDPISTVASALGGCTNITVQMYAKRKEYPLEKVITEVLILQDPAASNAKMFQRDIQLIGNELKPEHRERLLAIANKCPVHRILENSTKIVTNLK